MDSETGLIAGEKRGVFPLNLLHFEPCPLPMLLGTISPWKAESAHTVCLFVPQSRALRLYADAQDHGDPS